MSAAARPHLVTIEANGASFSVGTGDTILRAGLRAGIPLPYECNVGCCGTCRVEVTDGETEALWPEAPGLTDRDRRRGRVLACQARPLGDVRIRVHLETMDPALTRPAEAVATLRSTRDVTSDIREFVFETEQPARFLPGQYALLHLPCVSAPRAYSMANIANPEGLWVFQVRLAPGGQGTSVLFSDSMPLGTAITLDGPYGLAHLRTDSDREIVCIAGGSGLAPMASIARGVAQDPRFEDRALHFFYGARTPLDVCGEDLLRVLPGFSERMHYEAAVSSPVSADDWPGWRGMVHHLVGERMGERLRDCEIYMAGPPPMIIAALEMLTADYGVEPVRIHFDRFF